MGKDIRLGLIVGCGLVVAIMIFWAVRGKADELAVAENEEAALSEQWVTQEDGESAESADSDAAEDGEDILVASLQGRYLDPSDSADSSSWQRAGAEEQGRVVSRARQEEVPVQQERRRVTTASADTRGRAATTVASAPESVRYTVQRGDNLYKIAEKFYKNGNQWRVIHQANIASLPNANRLKLGQELVIPQRAE